MKNRTISLFLLSIFASLFAIHSVPPNGGKADVENLDLGSLERPYILNQNWLFQPGDDPGNAAETIDGAHWVSGSPLFPWKYMIPEGQNYSGNAWYRLAFLLDDFTEEEIYAIFLPYSYGGMEVYVNGNRIHSNGAMDVETSASTMGSRPELAIFSGEVLKKGKNILALRAGSVSGWGGFNVLPRIGPYDQIEQIWSHFLIRHFIIGAVSIFMGLYFLLFYFLRRSEKYYLWIALLSLSVGIHIPGLYGLWKHFVNDHYSYILPTFFFGLLNYYALIQFYHAFFSVKKNAIARIFEAAYGISMLFVVVELLFSGRIRFYANYLYMPVILSTLGIPIYLIVMNTRAMLQRWPYAKMILPGIIIFAFTLINSALVNSGVMSSELFFLGEGYLAMLVVFSSILALRFSNTHKELAESHERLKTLDVLKDEFLANTSHELKTPLAGIIGISESMLAGAAGEINKKIRSNLLLIMRSGKRLSGLVNDILDFSRMKKDDLQLSLHPLDAFSVIEATVLVSKELIQEKDLKIEIDLDRSIPYIYADENRFQQILYNLLGNAIKFTDQGEIRINAYVQDQQVYFGISDTGIGIPPEKQKDIFHSFEQGDGSISRTYGGSGLGLSITRQLVQLHGGGIFVESNPGQGSTFTFSMPVYSGDKTDVTTSADGKILQYVMHDTVSAADTEQNPLASVFRKRTNARAQLLVVDDDPTIVQVLSNQLELEQFEVHPAFNGKQALKLLDIKPDLMILDLMMPGMNGFEVAKRVREKFGITELPIIMLSARNQLNDMVQGYEAGVNDYLTKPFSKVELLTRVNIHVEVRSLYNRLKDYSENLENMVEERTEELNDTLSLVKEANEQIMNSIDYASRIQSSILPDLEALETAVKEKMIIWKPRDGVGGDFYQVFPAQGGKIVFLGDCTGHGIPGALMTMISYAGLRRIVLEDGVTDPAQILKSLNTFIRTALGQDQAGAGSDDGLDAAIVFVNANRNEMLYAGARLPLYIMRGNTVNAIRGDRSSLGYNRSRPDYEFQTRSFELEDVDRIFLASDGYISQIGGESESPLGYERFQALLEQCSDSSMMACQKQLLEFFDEYRGEMEQLDDVTIFGIEFDKAMIQK